MNITAVRHKNIARDRQSHTCACNLMTHVLSPIEFIEDACALGFREWLAFILNGDDNMVSCEACGEPDSGSPRRIPCAPSF